MAVWTVKGGRRGEREERLLQNGLIGGGWESLPSIASAQSKDELAAIYDAAYPTALPAARANYVGQLWSLKSRMQVGELVVLPLKTTGTIAVGAISLEMRSIKISSTPSEHSSRSGESIVRMPRRESGACFPEA